MRSADDMSLTDSLSAPGEEEIRRLLESSATTNPFGGGSGDSRTICPSVDTAVPPPPPPGEEEDFEILCDTGAAREGEIEAHIPDSVERSVTSPSTASARETCRSGPAILPEVEKLDRILAALSAIKDGLEGMGAGGDVQRALNVCGFGLASDPAPSWETAPWMALAKKLRLPEAAIAWFDRAAGAVTGTKSLKKLGLPLAALVFAPALVLLSVKSGAAKSAEMCDAARRAALHEVAALRREHEELLGEVRGVHSLLVQEASAAARRRAREGRRAAGIEAGLDRILSEVADVAKKAGGGASSGCPNQMFMFPGDGGPSFSEMEGTLDRILVDLAHLKNSTTFASNHPQGVEATEETASDTACARSLQKNSDGDASSFQYPNSLGNTVRGITIQAKNLSDSSSQETREETGLVAAAKSFGSALSITVQGLVEYPLTRKLPAWPLGSPTLQSWADWCVALALMDWTVTLALLSLCGCLHLATARWSAAKGTPSPVVSAEPPAGQGDGGGDPHPTGPEKPTAKEAGTNGNGPTPVAQVPMEPPSGHILSGEDPTTSPGRHRGGGSDLSSAATSPESDQLAPERRNKKKREAAAPPARRVKISYAVADAGATGLGPVCGPNDPFPPLLARGFVLYNGADPALSALKAILRAAVPGCGDACMRLWSQTGPASLRKCGTAGATAGGDGWDLVDLGVLKCGGGDGDERGLRKARPATVAEWAARHRAYPAPLGRAVWCAEVLVEVRRAPSAPWPRSPLELPRRICVGDFVDAQDGSGRWYEAVVREVTDFAVKVHYMGWSSKWDAYVSRGILSGGGAELPSGRRKGGLYPPAPLWSRTPRWRDGVRVGDVVEVREVASPPEHPRWFRAVVRSVGKESDPVHDVVGGAELEALENNDEWTLPKGDRNGSDGSGRRTLLLLGRTRQVLVEVPKERPATPAQFSDSASSEGMTLTSSLDGKGTPIPLANPPYLRWVNLYGEEICEADTHNKVRPAD